MTLKKEIEQACADLEKLSSLGVEQTLWDAFDRIERLEKALKHIKKTARANAKGKIMVAEGEFNDEEEKLKDFIDYMLEEDHIF